jgi:hypothetical protein
MMARRKILRKGTLNREKERRTFPARVPFQFVRDIPDTATKKARLALASRNCPTGATWRGMSGVAENLRTGCKLSRKRVQLRHDATCQICKTTLIFAEKFRTTGIDFEHETILNIAAQGTRHGQHQHNLTIRPAYSPYSGCIAVFYWQGGNRPRLAERGTMSIHNNHNIEEEPCLFLQSRLAAGQLRLPRKSTA